MLTPGEGEGWGRGRLRTQSHVRSVHISVDVKRAEAVTWRGWNWGAEAVRGFSRAQRAGSRVAETEVKRTEGTVSGRLPGVCQLREE